MKLVLRLFFSRSVWILPGLIFLIGGCLRQVVDPDDTENTPVTQQERDLHSQAMEALGQGDRPAEQRVWKKLTTQFPRSRYAAEAHRRLGFLAFEQKQWLQAILHFKQVQRRRLNRSVRVYVDLHLARAYFARSQWDQAFQLLSHTYPRLPENQQFDVLQMLVRCAKQRKQPLDILYWKYKSWERLSPGEAKERIRRQMLQHLTQLPEASLRQVQSGRDHKNQPIDWGFLADYAAYRLAAQYERQQQYAKARQLLARLTQKLTLRHPLYHPVMKMYAEVKDVRRPAKSQTLGVILPMTGKYALIGQIVRNGIDLALQDYPQVRVFFRDSMSLPAQAVAAVNDLVLREQVIAIFGPPMKETARAAGLRAQQLHVPMFSITAQENFPTSGSFLFRNNLTPAMMAKATARYAFDTLRIRKMAILYPASMYGKIQARAFLDEIKRLGAESGGAMEFDADAQDFMFPVKMLIGTVFANAHILKVHRDQMKKMKPYQQIRLRKKMEKMLQPLVPFESLFIAAPSQITSQIAAHLAYYNVGLKRPAVVTGFNMAVMSAQEQFRNIQLFGNQDGYDKHVFQAGEAYIRGALFCTRYFRESYQPASQQFTRAYTQQFKSEPIPISAYAYDTMRILASIAAREHVRTRIRFRQELLAIKDFDGPTGPMSINTQGETHAPIKFIMAYRGKFRLHGELK